MKMLYFYTPTSRSLKGIKTLGVEVESINALKDVAKVDEYNICVAPTLILFDDEGNEVKRAYRAPQVEEIQDIISNTNTLHDFNLGED